MKRLLLAVAAALVVARSAHAEPTLWQRVTEPGSLVHSKARLRAEQLYAEQLSEDANDARADGETERHLALESAALLELSGGARRDPWQAVLLGRILLDAGSGREAQAMTLIEQGVSALADSDFKGSSLFDLGLAATFSGDMDRATKALSAALALAWDSDDRANLLRNRGKALLLAGHLTEAVASFRAAVRAARAPDVRALSHFGLGVALERSGDYPQGLEEVGRGVALRLPSPPYAAENVLDLPEVRFFPEYDVHYYRALGAMSEALDADSSEREMERYQAALESWQQYLPAAEAAGDRFLPNARRHQQRCLDALLQLKKRAEAARGSRRVR